MSNNPDYDGLPASYAVKDAIRAVIWLVFFYFTFPPCLEFFFDGFSEEGIANIVANFVIALGCLFFICYMAVASVIMLFKCFKRLFFN